MYPSSDRVVALAQTPDVADQHWINDAACDGVDLPVDAYFPPEGAKPQPSALDLCAACQVRDECLATALVNEQAVGHRYGWWGGYGPQDRNWIALALDLDGVTIATSTVPDLSDPKAMARHLRDRGHTIPAIADELGCTPRTVHRYLAATKA